MTNPPGFLALDLGAESGRAMLGQISDGLVTLTEIHRFQNLPVRLPDGLHWDTPRLWSDIKDGICLAGRQVGDALVSVGVDTWGVDFGLLDRDGVLIGIPYHYRDSRTDGMYEEVFARMPREEVFAQTGIQFLILNTLYQLMSMVVHRSPAMDIADTLLMTPDLFNYWLCGSKVSEFSIATTSQCFDTARNEWAWPLLERLGIPTHIFPTVVPSGTVLGQLSPWLTEELGLSKVAVVAPACHDTGSAVAGIPAANREFAWISSGTWSIVGAELPQPVINAQALAYNLTNEGGYGPSTRFCRNVMGLWLVQQCRRTWAQQGQEHSYQELTELAAQAAPLQRIIDPDRSEFMKPGDMPARVREYCRRTHQSLPETKGEVVRCILEGIALRYRWIIERLEEVLGHRLDPIHIVGGGTKNQLLSQMAADALGRQVITGPIEATALGNIIVQAIATRHLGSLADGREVVRRSFPVNTFEPGDRSAWDDAYGRFLDLLQQTEA
jgi:rhamnulokinase